MGVSTFILKFLFPLIGGLGIFLLGMKNMSEGMQSVAGASLRRIIAAVTSKPLFATIAGMLVTWIVQSSSVTTVMVVGFVNSGVMQLSQAIGVIMGANIGTTITGWILTLKVGKYGLPLLGVSAFFYLFSKGDRLRYWAMFAMGVGMVFFGLEIMKDACAVIKEMPDFASWFQRFQADSYFGVLKCAFAGCVLTMIVQSSSATLGITISLAVAEVISYETAAALVLGENIGTTITAFLASLGTTTNARRAAYFHVIFNIIGVFWITLIFQWYIQLIHGIFAIDFIDSMTGGNVTAKIAATHSVFNIVNTLMFLPFVPFFTKFLERIVPGKTYEEKTYLADLDIRMLDTPMLAIEQSRAEILKMGDGCEEMMEWLRTLAAADTIDKELSDALRQREKSLDVVQDEVTHFVTSLLSGNVPHSAAEEARAQLRLADEYESVSDYIDNIWKFDRKLRKDDLRFTPTQREALTNLHQQVAEYVKSINEANRQENADAFTDLEVQSKAIRQAIKESRRAHLAELSSETIAPQVSVAFLASLNAYARVRDHAQNIGEVVAGEK